MNLEHKRRNASFAGAFLAGATSGACSTILFQPLDVVKTRLQESAVNHPHLNRQMLPTFTHLVFKNGFTSLWAGLTPSLWRCVPGVAVYFTTLEAMKSMIPNPKNEPLGSLQALGLGASARSLTGALLMPFTVIKTRFESGRYNYKSVMHALSSIYRSEGARGLMSGLGATLARDVPFSAIYYAVYTQVKEKRSVRPSNTVENSFICGLIAGIFASVVTHPADVVKTSLQLATSRYRTGEAIMFIYESRGLTGFFAGLMPRLVRRTLISAMTWTVYDKVMKYCETI